MKQPTVSPEQDLVTAHKANLRARMRDVVAKMEIGPAVEYVIKQLQERLDQHRTPSGSVLIKDQTWVPTGRWQLHIVELTTHQIKIELTLIWRSTAGKEKTNPNEPAVGVPPDGFAPEFTLPHSVSYQLSTTEMPSEGDWATGVAPGIDQGQLDYFKELFYEEVDTLGCFDII